jgi:hypothetical protein
MGFDDLTFRNVDVEVEKVVCFSEHGDRGGRRFGEDVDY